MTADELAELVQHGPHDQLVAALAPLTERERKALAKTAIELRKSWTMNAPGMRIFGVSLAPQQSRRIFQISHQPDAQRLKLALLALGPWGEAQHIRAWHLDPARTNLPLQEQLFQVLSDRKPEWLPKWADKELEERNFSDWHLVRRLIRAGLCPRPQSDAYILKMLGPPPPLFPSLTNFLFEDAELLEDEVWRIFELSPVRDPILWAADADDPERPYSWAGALRNLSRTGMLDRSRLLLASLTALLRNTEPRNTSWFARFHEVLEPTDDERQALPTNYLQLLSHPVGGVAAFALNGLTRLQKARKLDVPGFLGAVPAMFHLKAKTQPLQALRLVKTLLAEPTVPVPPAVESLLAALAHEAVEVQEAALELLHKLADRAGDVVGSVLATRINDLAPSVQEQARQLLRATHPEAAADPQTAGGSEALEEARQIPSPWREQAGIDVLLAALEGEGELQPVAFDPMAVPRLYPEQRLTPIATLDELIDRLTTALEGLEDGIEFELLLDGVSRLCDQRPDDFEARLAPLLHRLRTIAPQATLGLHLLLFKLIERWAGANLLPSYPLSDDKDLITFLELRVGALAVRARKAQAAPLLACPTHRPGWIEPAELVRRLGWYQQHGLEPSAYDLVQGLVRLAPDGRAETLALATSLQGTEGVALRFALGGPLEDPSLPAALRIAAGRSRAPGAALEELVSLGSEAGPDAFVPARYAWMGFSSRQGQQDGTAVVKVTVTPGLPDIERMRSVPTVLLHTWRLTGIYTWWRRGAANRWAATVWPANRDPIFAAGAGIRPGQHLQADQFRQRANFLEPLFDPDVPFTEMAQLLVALALTQKEAEVSGLAVDVLIELIRDGRCTGSELGGVFARLLPDGAIKLNRLGGTLSTVARASLLHTHVCARILQEALPGLPDATRELAQVLEPLLQWLTALEEGVQEPARSALDKVRSGKAATLAKRLLQLPATSNKRRQVLLEALQERIARAQRWAF